MPTFIIYGLYIMIDNLAKPVGDISEIQSIYAKFCKVFMQN